MPRIRIGVIGLGAIAQAVHLPNLARLWECFDIVHVCDVGPGLADDVAGHLGGNVSASTDPQTVFENPKVDAVMILASGPHAPLARSALEAGKHVFVEKPLALTVDEAADLHRRAAIEDRVLQVGYMKVYDELVNQARDEFAALPDGRLIRVAVLHPSETSQQGHLTFRRAMVPASILAASQAYDREMTRRAIGDLPEVFGWLYREVALGSLIHQVAVIRHLVGVLPTSRIDVDAWPLEIPGTSSARGLEPPTISISATYSDRQRLRIDWVWGADLPSYVERYEVVGPSKRLELVLPTPYALDQTASLIVDDVQEGRPGRFVFRGSHRSGFQAELEAFYAAIVGHQALPVDASGVAADTAFAQQVIAALAVRHGFHVGGEAGTAG